MKAGIITIYDLLNYGNRLQNYAVTKIFEDLGYEVDTLLIDEYRIKDLIKIILFRERNIHWNVRQESEEFFLKQDELSRKKYLNFKEFTYKYMSIKKVSGSKLGLKYLNHEYDIFIAGGDQIWNPLIGHAIDWEFLTFADNKKKISIAPSFGIGELPDVEKKAIKRYLKDFEHISVREKTGQDIIRDLLSKESTLLVDPTLLITKEDWLKIASTPSNVDLNRPYILLYFLGTVSDRIQERIDRIAAETGYQVLNLFDKSNPDLFSASPSDFVSLIAQAKIVLTDSFHASVFSLIFERPFLVFNRAGKHSNMSSRIENFIDMFKLQRKYVQDEAAVDYVTDIWEHDYSESLAVLNIEKERALSFIMKAI